MLTAKRDYKRLERRSKAAYSMSEGNRLSHLRKLNSKEVFAKFSSKKRKSFNISLLEFYNHFRGLVETTTLEPDIVAGKLFPIM